jgi:hypothetical protein
MYGTYNSICSLPLLLLPLLCWVTGFLPSSALPFSYALKRGYDSGEGLLLGLAALLDDDVDC